MQCKKCGNNIVEGEMYCRLCNESVCMVPEYSLQDEILIHQVTMALEGNKGSTQDSNAKRREQTSPLMPKEVEERRRKLEYKRRQRKRKRDLFYCSLVLAFILILCGIYYIYSNSYSGLINSGEKCVANKEYDEAIVLYKRAIKKRTDGIVAYEALSELYVLDQEFELVETLLLDGVKYNELNLGFYELAIDYYLTSEQYDKVMPFFNEYLVPSLIDELDDYLVYPPEFSLEEGTFDDVREVSLLSEGGKILYAIEEVEGELTYQEYTDPIQISDGVTTVVSVVENELGITSVPVRKKYQVELPVEGAPIVSPSTGQYSTATDISVQVPVGYTAYYTTDGSVPDDTSKVYEKTFAMPKGNTVLSVILINSSGKKSDVTKRNYELAID